MSVQAYKNIANETDSDLDMAYRVITSIISYIGDIDVDSITKNVKTESLLNAHTLTSGALLSLSRNATNKNTTFLFNVFDYVQVELLKEIRGHGQGNLDQINIMLSELIRVINKQNL